AIDDARRRAHRRPPCYVVVTLRGPFPDRTPPRRPFGLRWPWEDAALSVEGFGELLERLAADARVAGVVLRLHALGLPPAKVQSLRQAVERFRRRGKRVVAYATQIDTLSYALATAADEIVVPESAEIHVVGLAVQATFLKDTLGMAGVEADIEAIAEYKTAGDVLRRSEMSPAHREMLDALLDSLYAQIVGAIAAGRRMSREAVRAAIDAMPMTARQAQAAGLVDALRYEDELGARLGAPGGLVTWEAARAWVRRPRRWLPDRAVGVVAVEGTIVVGPSRRLPLPIPRLGVLAGSETVIQALRQAERQQHIAAVVLLVDSPGGSALASDLIWREVRRLARKKPVVASFGPVAASGGYYVAAGASAIVAQPGTITGSIGILGGKVVTAGLFAKLRAGRELLWRGAAAAMLRDAAPFSGPERARLQALLADGYERFLARVADGRRLTRDAVQTVARGRVWSGEQALERGLVDELGDFELALARAKALAGLDPRRWTPVVALRPAKLPLLAPPWPPASAGGWAEALGGLRPGERLALCPWTLTFGG
ncbi:MAG: signal peptide peptidase SppA, partial [Chloroflexi bacterium]|nr:signal peptide peptidase SppA [Chloroflexota bacterium]